MRGAKSFSRFQQRLSGDSRSWGCPSGLANDRLLGKSKNSPISYSQSQSLRLGVLHQRRQTLLPWSACGFSVEQQTAWQKALMAEATTNLLIADSICSNDGTLRSVRKFAMMDRCVGDMNPGM
jgi:hypothetical protein